MVLATILAAVGLLGATALQAYTLLHLRDQQSRLDRRIADVAGRVTARGRAAAAPRDGGHQPAGTSVTAAALAFALPDQNGRAVSLAGLLAPTKPLLLVFLDPRCGPCYELLPDLGGWQRVYGDRLTVALVSGGSPDANRAMTAEYGIVPGSVLLQSDGELVAALGIAMAPAAVVIRPDGRLAGEPALGAHAVRELAADTLGLRLPPAATADVRAVGPGEPAPRILRPDLDGNPVGLAADRTAATLLLFWSPGCAHCQELLPLIRERAGRSAGPRLLVATRGPVALNREARLEAPTVLDDDRALAQAFGVTGTPAAVLIDAQNRVASEVARGATAVRTLLQATGHPNPGLAA